MAIDDTLDPFGTPDLAVNPNPSSSTFGDTLKQWDTFLADPKNRAAVMSFGLQLMQPIGLGQNAAGAFGQAVGQAGEGIRTAEKLDIAQSDAERKAQDAENRANDRDRRAQQAESRLGIQGENLRLSGLRFGLAQDTAKRRLDIQQQLADIRDQRNAAKTDYERQRLDQQEQALQNQIRRLDLYEGDTRRTGEVTERDAFRQAGGATRDLSHLATLEADRITKQLTPDPLNPRGFKVPDTLKGFTDANGQPLPHSDIRAKLINDPEWRRQQTGRAANPVSESFTATPGAPDPNSPGDTIEMAPLDPRQRVVGRTYRGPSGNTGVWTGNGWQTQ